MMQAHPAEPSASGVGRSICITGANRGIGLALALEALQHGWRVFAGCRRPEHAAELQAAAARAAQRTETAPVILPLDIDDPKSAAQFGTECALKTNSIDVLVNNAAIFPEEGDESFLEIDPAHFTAAFKTNVVGTLLVTRALWPLLLQSANPAVVNISSGAGSIASKTDSDYIAYATSKAALNMLTRAIAAEAKADEVTVVAVSPGWVRTDMGGAAAPLSSDESARDLLASIATLAPEKTGLFLDRFGNEHELGW